MSLVHRFSKDISGIELPDRFTFPFYYKPHELASIASQELQEYLESFDNWFFDLNLGPKNYKHHLGKMFGVLVVRDSQDELGYLTAFSGVITGEQENNYFVPLVYNMFETTGRYAIESKELAFINDRIYELEHDENFLSQKIKYQKILEENEEKIQAQIAKHKKQKQARKESRNLALGQPEDLEKLRKKHHDQSMKEKFLLREYRAYLEEKATKAGSLVTNQEKEISRLKSLRKEKSNELQSFIFEQYNFLNAKGESRTALDIFKNVPPFFPPSGTGDCCAPKLLQYAYLNKLEPICMAEFWYGESPPSQVRKHGNFYPACRSKCEPLLLHMLQGLQVDENPMLQNPAIGKVIDIIYEDEYIVVINKPAEFLSVRGKNISDSVEERMRARYPNATGPMILHRLDMSTSGIMIIALDKKGHKRLQEQFITRTVSKKYTAVLDGIVQKQDGFISLPLRVDLDNRPYQLVDPVHGKNARTKFEVIEVKNGYTKVNFYPITGRTHQLRVHAAHHEGLNAPIKGDDLYGTKQDRLYLHAQELTIVHPYTKEKMTFEAPSPF
ncbi:pseudouridine synthase [Nonlabens sp. MIC269]|uniref:RluA family pseudouridine synthase n=1 Tax=Nonlabens sp. MIC269 TaxID=1476901 RepID=UPI000720D371|nr:RluA family pseudouridine synthase [Nonlabens sp. MIC269]ALM20270.1 pseudouridine synthase [Nonlabens sp. MIC269]